MKLLSRLGFSSNESKVYLHLLKSGASSIRQIAGDTSINRGTVYEALKKLSDRGLVSRSQKKSNQQFAAENPEALQNIFREERQKLVGIKKELGKSMPELLELYGTKRDAPVIRIYEGHSGTRQVLEDVLKTMSRETDKLYRVYSAANIREYLYFSFASFSERRVKLGIKARVISLGGGGELRGLDERRYLTLKRGAPAYTIIYAKKTAIISLCQGRPHAVLIEDAGLAETQRLVFEELWKNLKEEAV